MSRKNVIKQLKLFEAESMAPSLVSAAVSIQWLDNASIQFVVTDTPQDGDLIVEVSNDHRLNVDGSVRDVGTWNAIPNLTQAILAGAPASGTLDANQLSSAFMRLRWDSQYVESADIEAVADVSGSLNDTYFLIDGADGDDWYVWFNVDTGGTDPALPDRTGIQVAISEDDTAATVGGALRTALAACTSIANITGAGADADFDQSQAGAGSVVDGAVPTGFTITYDGGDGLLTATLHAKAI